MAALHDEVKYAAAGGHAHPEEVGHAALYQGNAGNSPGLQCSFQMLASELNNAYPN